LRETDEQLESRYRLKTKGFEQDRVAERVAQVMDIAVKLVWEESRRPMRVVCFAIGPRKI